MNYNFTSEWDSGIRTADQKILVDSDLLHVANAIQAKIGNIEFSILAKGEWTEEGFVICSDYIIPKQTVTITSVDFDDQEEIAKLKADGYNVVIHSHPFARGSSDFSGADESTINSHFDCSLLLCDGKFVSSCCRVHISNDLQLHLKLPVETYIDINYIDINVSNINQRPIAHGGRDLVRDLSRMVGAIGI